MSLEAFGYGPNYDVEDADVDVMAMHASPQQVLTTERTIIVATEAGTTLIGSDGHFIGRFPLAETMDSNEVSYGKETN